MLSSGNKGEEANPIIDPIYIFEINRGVLTPVPSSEERKEPPAAVAAAATVHLSSSSEGPSSVAA